MNLSKSKSKSKSKNKSKNKSKSKTKSKTQYMSEIKEKFRRLKNTKTTKSFIKKEKLSARDRIYKIEDNGGIPWIVKANDKGIHVYTYKKNRNEDNWNEDWNEDEYNVHLLTLTKFIGFWPGQDIS